jgi:ankyrin repeat protein
MSTADDSLYWDCYHGSKHRIVELVNQKNVNYVHPIIGDTPLHQACKQGWLDIVEMLIEKYGCDPNKVTKSGESVLHYACQCDKTDDCGNIDVVKYLINKHHLNPLMRNNINQLEPLDYAVNNNQHYTAVYLCQHCISSDDMLSPNRIKTTINLLSYIADPWACS